MRKYQNVYGSIEGISLLTGINYPFLPLKAWSNENAIPVKYIAGLNDTYKEAYNSLAWYNVFGLDIVELMNAVDTAKLDVKFDIDNLDIDDIEEDDEE